MTRTYLATTGISEIWDKDSKLLLLGPWCLTSKENIELLKDKPYEMIPSAFKPAIKTKDAADYCYGVYKELLPKLSEKMNALHDTSYPICYWQVLLGYWLLIFIGVFYDRYKRLEHAFDIFPDLYTHIIAFQQSDLATVDTYDMLSLNGKVNSDYYNLGLFSLIAHYLHPDKTVEIDYREEVDPKINNKNLKLRLFNFIVNSSGIFNPPIILSDMSYLHPYESMLLEWKVGVNKIGFKDFITKDTFSYSNFSTDIRRKLSIEGEMDKFQILLFKILPYIIPMCYIENYHSYQDKVENNKNIQAVGSTNGWYFNEGFKFFAASSASNGAKLLDFQHGGGYGVELSIPHEKLCLEKDVFFTWGWEEGNKKTIPLPIPYLSKSKKKCFSKNITFVSTSLPKYQFRFESSMQPEDIVSYLYDMKVFFQSLNNEIICVMLFRPNVDSGWNIIDTIKNEYPDLPIVTNGKLVDLMKKTKLVVIDHAHTSFLEALVMNVPTILYWDHDVFLMRPEAEEYFELLRNVGILHKDPISAAKKVNEVFDDPTTWWNQPQIQNARNKFCQKFALTSENWLEEWKKALETAIVGTN